MAPMEQYNHWLHHVVFIQRESAQRITALTDTHEWMLMCECAKIDLNNLNWAVYKNSDCITHFANERKWKTNRATLFYMWQMQHSDAGNKNHIKLFWLTVIWQTQNNISIRMKTCFCPPDECESNILSLICSSPTPDKNMRLLSR